MSMLKIADSTINFDRRGNSPLASTVMCFLQALVGHSSENTTEEGLHTVL